MSALRAGLATFAVLASVALPALAQNTPVGLWRNLDDKTGEAKGEVRIQDTPAGLVGTLEKRLGRDARPDDICKECSDDLQGQRLLGLQIIRGGSKVEGKEVWEGGKILDPENGRNYTLRLTPIEGGKKLEVRGSFGPFGRTQTWVRVQ